MEQQKFDINSTKIPTEIDVNHRIEFTPDQTFEMITDYLKKHNSGVPENVTLDQIWKDNDSQVGCSITILMVEKVFLQRVK